MTSAETSSRDVKIKAITTEEIYHPTASMKHILFVDDEKAIAAVYKQTLERLGYKVTAKTNSIEAFEIFKQIPGSFDLVISDISMPDQTGIDLAKALLKIRPGIPIILCTGYSDLMNREKAREIGIREFVLKPLNINELAKMINDLLH